MAKPTNKQELIAAMQVGYEKLNEQISKLDPAAATAPFGFVADPKKCGVRWLHDRCLRDLLAHLYEWQVLMRIFVQNIRDGQPKDYLPDEYRKNYHEMDRMLVERHQSTSLDEAKRLLEQTHHTTYTTTMAAYFDSVTTSPYSQAVKLLKLHAKTIKEAKV